MLLNVHPGNEYNLCPNVYHYNAIIWKYEYKKTVSELRTLDFEGEEGLELWQGFKPSTCYKKNGIGEMRVFREEPSESLNNQQFEEIVQRVGSNLSKRFFDLT